MQDETVGLESELTGDLHEHAALGASSGGEEIAKAKAVFAGLDCDGPRDELVELGDAYDGRGLDGADVAVPGGGGGDGADLQRGVGEGAVVFFGEDRGVGEHGRSALRGFQDVVGGPGGVSQEEIAGVLGAGGEHPAVFGDAEGIEELPPQDLAEQPVGGHLLHEGARQRHGVEVGDGLGEMGVVDALAQHIDGEVLGGKGLAEPVAHMVRRGESVGEQGPGSAGDTGEQAHVVHDADVVQSAELAHGAAVGAKSSPGDADSERFIGEFIFEMAQACVFAEPCTQTPVFGHGPPKLGGLYNEAGSSAHAQRGDGEAHELAAHPGGIGPECVADDGEQHADGG